MAMNSFDNYEFENAQIYAKEMSCQKCETLESLSATIDCKWNSEEIESLVLKEIFKVSCSNNE